MKYQRETENIKKQMFSLKLKSVIAKINYKNSPQGLSSRRDDRGMCQ